MRGRLSARGAGAIAVALGLAGACTYDFDQFAAPSGAHPSGGSAGTSAGGSGGSSSTTLAGMEGAGRGGASGSSSTGGTAGSAGAAGSGGATADGAGGTGAGGTAGADAGATAGTAGGGNGGVGGAGTGGSGGSPVADASDSGSKDAPADVQSPADASDASIDAGFDCSSVSGTAYMGHCYFGRTGPFTWDVAATSCPAGAHLVTITSSAEQAIAQQILPNQDRWIGMREPATAPNMEQFYYWVTGEPFTPGTSYTNWDVFSDADREPNFTGDCVRMEFNSKWADDACTKAYSAICESE